MRSEANVAAAGKDASGARERNEHCAGVGMRKEKKKERSFQTLTT